MAKQTVTTLVDDLDGGKAVETVPFALDGMDFEIDLSAKNAARLRKTFSKWADHARVTGGVPSQSRVKLPAAGQSRNALIRVWAAEQGMQVPARGRIPQSVVTAYDQSN